MSPDNRMELFSQNLSKVIYEQRFHINDLALKLYTMLQEMDIDEVSNFFNILFKNKLQYKLVVIFYLFVF